jgi:hypothetical protein
MSHYSDHWPNVQSVQPVPLVGELPQGEPEPVPVTVSAMIAKLRNGVREQAAMLQRVLIPDHWSALQSLVAQGDTAFTFPSNLWAQIVFDFALAYCLPGAEREALIAAQVPLYYGRIAGMVYEATGMDSDTFERAVVQAQAAVFEKLKPELVQRWVKAHIA